MANSNDLISLISNLDQKQIEAVSIVVLSMSAAKGNNWSGKLSFDLFIRKGQAQNIQVGSDRSIQLGNGAIGKCDLW